VSSSRVDRWLSPRLAARFRGRLDDARQAFSRSLAVGAGPDAVEIALGASYLWRQAMGSAEGGRWVEDLLRLDLSPDDALWARLLLADVGQGRGDHRQLFAAAVEADTMSRALDDPAAACIASHFSALATLTVPTASGPPLARAMDLARASGEDRLVALVDAFGVVADAAAGRLEEAAAAAERIDRSASDEDYDRYILNWAAWIAALAGLDPVARRWIEAQHAMLGSTGIGRTWLTTLSSSLCDVLDGLDPRPALGAALALADAEGFRAEADGVLVLAYAALRAGEPEQAAEHIGTAVRGRFNATAHQVLYRAVVEPLVRTALDETTLAAAVARGRERTPAEALAAAGVAAR
jgi:hypothetical protein